MASLVLITIATSDYASKWNFCIQSQTAYANANGYQQKVINSVGPKLHPKWAKLDVALQFLATSNVMLLDADAEITNLCPPANQIFAQYPSKDIFYVKGNSGRPNSGVLLLRGGTNRLAFAFVKHCIRHRREGVPPQDFVSPEGENGHVIWSLRLERFRARAHELPTTWNCSKPACAPTAFIRHYTNQLRIWLQAGNAFLPGPRSG